MKVDLVETNILVAFDLSLIPFRPSLRVWLFSRFQEKEIDVTIY
jgi:hypothetical protein